MSEPASTAESVAKSQPLPLGAWWRLPLLLAIVLAAIVVARSSQNGLRGPLSVAESSPPPGAAESGQTVTLEIDYADGRKREFAAIPWYKGMTVDELMSAASREPDSFNYSVHGDLAMTMLGQIDDVQNQGAAGRNWTYSVNGKAADRSLAVYELQPGDRVLWTFALPQ